MRTNASPALFRIAYRTLARISHRPVRNSPDGPTGVGLSLLLLLLLGALSPAGAQPQLSFDDLFEDEVIARGDGVEIKQSQLDKAFMAYRSNLAARGQRFPESERVIKEAQLLDRMITTFILTNQATRMDQTLAQGQTTRFFDDSKASAGSDDSFERQLRLTGLTEEDFRQRILEQFLAETVLERELADKITVSDEEVTAFYETGRDYLIKIMEDEIRKAEGDPDTDPAELERARRQVEGLIERNLQMLQEPEKVHVSHVLISTRYPDTEEQVPVAERQEKRRLAEEVLAQAKSGEDFDALIRRHSQDRNLPETDGHYILSREEPFAPEFKSACFSLAPGQISDIVTTVFGFHIIKCHELISPQKRPLDQAAPSIKEFLSQQKLRQHTPAFLETLKSEANMKILEPKYRLP